jgi:hypothetical protein
MKRVHLCELKPNARYVAFERVLEKDRHYSKSFGTFSAQEGFGGTYYKVWTSSKYILSLKYTLCNSLNIYVNPLTYM